MFDTFLRIFFDLHTVAVIGFLILAGFIWLVIGVHRQERRARKARGGLLITSGLRASDFQVHVLPPADSDPESYSWADIVSRSRDDGPDTEEFEMTGTDHGEARRKTSVRTERSQRGDDTAPADQTEDDPWGLGDFRRTRSGRAGEASDAGRTGSDELDLRDLESIRRVLAGLTESDGSEDDELPTDRAVRPVDLPVSGRGSGTLRTDES